MKNDNERILAHKTASIIDKAELEQISGGCGSNHYTTKITGSATGGDVTVDVIWD